MLIYAYLREIDGVDLIFFPSKEAYPIVKQVEKITVKKAQAKVVKCTKNISWVPRNPPWSLKCYPFVKDRPYGKLNLNDIFDHEIDYV